MKNMKQIIAICLFILLPGLTWSQNVELIQNEIRTTSYQNRSYLVVQSFTIKPPSAGSFYVNASTNGSFYISMTDASKQPVLAAPSPDQNFVREESVLISGITQESQIPNLSVYNKSTLYRYIDGMGREMETVKLQASPGVQQNDVVQAEYYDAMGNKTKEYLPYTNGQKNGAFRSAFDAETKSFYTNTSMVASESQRPFTEHVYESSSLGRVTDSYGPGNIWYSNSRRNQVVTNVETNGTIKKWTYVDDNTAPTISTYPANALLIRVNIDEDNHAVREFVDQLGQTVLRQKQVAGDYINSPASVTWLETYYVYDDIGNLKVVISPEGASRVATEYVTDNATKMNFLQRWGFQYRYDEMKNMIAKWLPGWKDWQYMIYDQWNRQVMVQTPAQRARYEWTFTKYDQYNRPIMTGLWVTTTDVATLRLNAAAASGRYETVSASTAEGYTLTSSYPSAISASNLVSITYYDNYNFLTANSGAGYPGWSTLPISTFNFLNLSCTPSNYVNNVCFPQSTDKLSTVVGYVTGTKTMVLNQPTATWLNSVTYYDTKYRAIQTISKNFIGGTDRQTTKYNFVGKVLQTQIDHTSSSTSVSVLREFTYDQVGRILNTYQTMDAGTRVLVSSNTYNEAGQLVEKNIHSADNGATFLQSVDQRYNIRGWVSSINNSTLTNDGAMNNDANDLFGMEIQYNSSTATTISGYPGNVAVPNFFNGNIGAIKWMTNTLQQGITPDQRIYGFDYDAANRMKGAYYAINSSGAWSGNAGMFNEQIATLDGSGNVTGTYDNNGNIKGIARNGNVEGVQTQIDKLTFNYSDPTTLLSSNRLMAVTDAAGNATGYKDGASASQEYYYDNSGNLNFDANKQISSISYNYLNLPEIIQFTRPGGQVDQIQYIYNAAGIKLRTLVSINGTQVAQYDYDDNFQYDNSQLTFVTTPEGRAMKNTTGYDYEYFYKDHQGNVRLNYGLLKETLSYKATMENPATSSLGNTENATFKNISTTRWPDATFNYTKSSTQVLTPANSARTNGALGNAVGPAKMLTLSSGDKVSMNVFAKYSVPTGSTATIATNVLITALATTTFGYASTETAYSTFNANAPGISGISSPSVTVPKAYLAYLFFNTSFQYVSSSAVSITSSAYNAFENLQKTFTATQDGYLYIYVANETNVSGSAGTVYFDEMQIIWEKNNSKLQVTQASDYYPFGLSFNTYQADRINENFSSTQKNRYGFQGQELQKDLDLGWSQFKWRMHDPALGRFGAVDPLSDKYVYNSTYAFSENRVVREIELEGAESFTPTPQYVEGLLWKDVGFSHRPNETETVDIGKKLAMIYARAYFTVMLSAAPVEEVGVGLFASAAVKFPWVAKLFGIAEDISRFEKTMEFSSKATPIMYEPKIEKNLAGSIRDVNKIGGTENCVNCAIATDATLAGRPASALNSKSSQYLTVLEDHFNAKFTYGHTIDQIKKMVSVPGQRGIVYGNRGQGIDGHVFNIVNQKGEIRLLDGQSGAEAQLENQGYLNFGFLKTN